ncbi:hypothetical protein [Kitasatospora sp. KL5]|uniref:hypothetical protein n=1 Tax=Kitasatospora sp. KL5 TaxID=3425125 RepID=UPI003D6EE15A
MKPVPNTEIVGTVTRFGLEASADGTAVLVAYTENDEGQIGRSWLRFDTDAVKSLKRRAERLPIPAQHSPVDITFSEPKPWSVLDFSACTNPDTATSYAAHILGVDTSGQDFWSGATLRILRGYLMAAAIVGADAETLLQWITKPTGPEPLSILRSNPEIVPTGWDHEVEQMDRDGYTQDSLRVAIMDALRIQMIS